MRRAVLALALLLWPVAADAGDVKSLTARARAHRKAFRYAEALELMRQAFALDPAPELLNNVAYLLDQLGRYREAHDTFRQVIAMPNTTAELKAKDHVRIRELEKKLATAWLRVTRVPGQVVRVDGRAWAFADEGAVLPGEHVVEIRDGAGRTIQIERTYSVTGRRSDVPTPVTVDRPFTTLLVRCPTEITALEIDRFELTRPIANDARVRIAKGNYDVRLDCRDRARWTARVDATARETLIPPVPLLEPPVVVAPIPQSPPEPTNWPPLLVGGAGLIAAGVGTGFFVSAGADSAELDDAAPMGGRATINYPTAKALDDQRRSKTNAGTVLLTAGVVAIVGGVVWYLVAD